MPVFFLPEDTTHNASILLAQWRSGKQSDSEQVCEVNNGL